jgi:capsular exopolysaccharide synthesis family protein
LIIALAGLVGFSLGAGAAFFLEYLDRTVKTTSDVERIFNLPVIGYISEIEDDEVNATYVERNPDSILAENFRLLRSNIEFFQISNPIKTLLITSPNQGNGKTTIASNLALSISQGEQEIVLVDADLRRPAIHHALGMSKEPGLAVVIKNKAEIQGVIRHPKDHTINVITSGTVPPNITEVVGSKRISSILSRLKDSFELVIVDAPPLIISDAFNLAAKVDAVILVMVPGETTTDQAKIIKEQLDRAEARVLGIVFNKLSGQTMHSYGDYQYQALYSPKYYGDYISGKTVQESQPATRSQRLMAFFEHGEVPPAVALEVENAITAIKTQPRNLVNKIRKPKSRKKQDNGKNGTG